MRDHCVPTENPWGQLLSDRDQCLVQELRKRVKTQLPQRYDTDFNLYRWVLHAQRYHKTEDGTLNAAEGALNHHLRLRRALKLDSRQIPSWDENPIHKERYLPKGPIHGIDKLNRVMWFSEYRTINIEALMQKLRSSEMLVFHFLLYEKLLEAAMKQEVASGRLSGIHFIADLQDYHMSPLSMLFVSNGSMGYYTHLFHYEHYPELFHPIDLVNTARWITIPYRLVKSIMPYGFSERFRIHGHSFKETLLKTIDSNVLLESLGGTNTKVATVPAREIDHSEYWTPSDRDPEPQDLQHIVVRARTRKLIPIDVEKTPAKLSWYYRTDAELHFGVFYLPPIDEYDSNEASDDNEQLNHMSNKQIMQHFKDKKIDIEEMEMVEPYFRIGARLVPETGQLICTKPGRYFMVFCNRNAWLTRRNVRLMIDLEASPKFIIQRTLSI